MREVERPSGRYKELLKTTERPAVQPFIHLSQFYNNMGKKKDKGNKKVSAAKCGTLKLDKYRREDVMPNKSTSSEEHKPVKPSKRQQSTADAYDQALLAVAERQMGKSKAATANLKAPKPIVIAPPTLILPEVAKETAFHDIDSMLVKDEPHLPTVEENQQRNKAPTRISTNRFGGLSDSEDDEKDSIPKLVIQPATFVWNKSS